MPLYEFVCRDCQGEQEILVRAGEVPACPSCGGQRMDKLLSVPAAHSASAADPRGAAPPSGPCGTACGCFPH